MRETPQRCDDRLQRRSLDLNTQAESKRLTRSTRWGLDPFRRSRWEACASAAASKAVNDIQCSDFSGARSAGAASSRAPRNGVGAGIIRLPELNIPAAATRAAEYVVEANNEVMRDLVRSLRSGNVAERRRAAHALDTAGWATAAERSALQKHLDSGEPDDETRYHIQSVLRRLAKAEQADRWGKERGHKLWGRKAVAVDVGGGFAGSVGTLNGTMRGTGGLRLTSLADGQPRGSAAEVERRHAAHRPLSPKAQGQAWLRKAEMEMLEQAVVQMNNPDVATRRGALLLIRRLGEAASQAAALVARHLHEDDIIVRKLALEALGSMGMAAAPHFELMLALLQHEPDVAVRRAAAIALTRSGAAVAPLAQELAHVGLQDPDKGIREIVAKALGALSAASAKHLARGLCDDSTKDRRRAASGLRRMGAAAVPQANIVAQVGLTDSDARVRAEATTALGLMHSLAKPHIFDVAKGMEDDDQRVRESAVFALCSILPLRGKTSWRLGKDPAQERILSAISNKCTDIE